MLSETNEIKNTMASIKKMKSRVAKFLRKNCGLTWTDAFKCASLMNGGGYDYLDFLIKRGYKPEVTRHYATDWSDGYPRPDHSDFWDDVKMNGYTLMNLDNMYDHYVLHIL